LELEGIVEDIIYQNEINSYTIAEFENEGELITVVGYLPFIAIGDSLKLYGKMVNHPEYGEQFKIDTFEKPLRFPFRHANLKYLGTSMLN